MASRFVPAVVLALLLVTAGCVGAPLSASSDDGNASVRTIDVAASDSASAPPDLAVVAVAVEVRADTANDAREAVAADVESMRAALRDAGVPDEAVRTTSYAVGPVYDHSGETREVVGYRAVHAVEIEVDVDRAGEVVDAAVAGGATRVQSVRFTLTDETRSELRREALSGAMSSARADAETIAGSADVSLGQLHSASTSDGGPRPIPVYAEAARGDGGGTVVEPGPVEVTATVSVAYEIR